MIVTERLKQLRLVRHYSDRGMMIKQIQTGQVFPEAIDPIDSNFTYKETNNPIEPRGPSPKEMKEILDILLGNQETE